MPSTPSPAPSCPAGVLCMWLVACGPVAEPWADQLQPEGPCLQVEVSDGLDDGAEVDALFHCLDHHGHLAPLRPAATAMQDTPAGTATPADRLAEAQRAAARADLEPFAGVVAAGSWLASPDRPTVSVLRTTAELLSGVPAIELPEARHEAPQRSPVHALAPALPAIAGDLLAEPAALGEVSDALAHDGVPAWLGAIADASEAAGVDRWLQAAGEARPLTISPDNDRHGDASGDSLRDLLEVWWLREGATLPELRPELAILLADPSDREALAVALVEAHDAGELEQVGTSAAWLATVDRHGEPLADPAEPSALARVVRVVATTNEPVECELDLWVTSFEWSFDNLAVRLLELLTQLDDDAIDDAGSLLASLTGGGVSEAVLRAAVQSGTCPTLTLDTLDDLDAVALLFEPEADPLRTVVVGGLRATPPGHLPALADATTDLWVHGGLPPVEELLRDIGSSQAIGGLGRLTGELSRPRGSEPSVVEQGLALAHQLATQPVRRHHVDHLGRALLGPDEAWVAIDRLADLAADPDSEVAAAPQLIREILTTDPQLELAEPLRVVLADEDVVRPLLEVASSHEVVQALTPPSSSVDDPAPTAWLAGHLVDGTLHDLARILAELLVRARHDTEPQGTAAAGGTE